MVTDVQYKKHSLLFSYKILIKKIALYLGRAMKADTSSMIKKTYFKLRLFLIFQQGFWISRIQKLLFGIRESSRKKFLIKLEL